MERAELDRRRRAAGCVAARVPFTLSVHSAAGPRGYSRGRQDRSTRALGSPRVVDGDAIALPAPDGDARVVERALIDDRSAVLGRASPSCSFLPNAAARSRRATTRSRRAPETAPSPCEDHRDVVVAAIVLRGLHEVRGGERQVGGERAHDELDVRILDAVVEAVRAQQEDVAGSAASSARCADTRSSTPSAWVTRLRLCDRRRPRPR